MLKKSTGRTQKQLVAENEDLRARLDEAEETLRAIRSGEVDALIVSGAGGEQLFTLKGADHSYRILIEDMNEGALTLTAEGVILYANRCFAEMLKMPLEKVVGSTIHTWVAPDRQRILQSLLRKGVDEKRREQLVLTASDGTLVPVYLSVSNLLINEMPDSFCLVATDLTEQKRSDAIAASEKLAQELLAASNQSRLELLRVIEDQKRAEELLAASEVRYRRLFESTKDGILILDAETGMVVDVNPFLIDLLDFSHEAFLGKAIWELGVFKDLVASEDKFLELQEKEYARYEDLPLQTAEGRVIDVEFVSNVYLVDGHKVIQCNIRDITERKRAQDALAASKAYVESVIQNFLDTLIVVDVEAKIRTVNPATCHLLGYTEKELIGQPISMIFAKEEEEEEEANRMFQFFREPEKSKALSLQDTIRNIELHYKTKDGRLVPMSFNASVLTDEAGNVRGVVGGAKDLTEIKLAEESRRKSEERFRKVIENIFEFVPEGLLTFTNKLNLFRTNKAFQDIVHEYSARLNYTEQELTEMIIEQVKNRIINEDYIEIRIPKKRG